MKIPRNRIDIAIEVLCLVILAGVTIYVLAGWSFFPDQIPMHYNAAGEIDRWGSKGEIFFPLAVTWILYLFITLLSRHPAMWNTGVSVTPENSARVYRILKYMIGTLKLAMVAVLSYLTVNTSTGGPLPGWFLPVTLILTLGNIAFWLICLIRNR